MCSARTVFCVVCVALIAAIVLPAAASAADGTIRIGTYDNRAIAIAYARSSYLPHAEKTQEFDRAEAAGDTVKMQEISDEMEALQRQLHRQGFSRAPVDDLLAHVAFRFPEVVEATGVDAIVWICDFTGDGVEVVDVTMDLVALYSPTEETIEMCKSIGDHEPVSLDELDHDH